ncbi:MAG: methyltransferase domain-containing protein, partial [Atopobiaceae bacterium]|nr:methyltransferase domain-containing protein [Atopobiaceae bacterium]
MRGMRARQPKGFVLEERLERYADAIELMPASLAGRWAEACWPAGSMGRFAQVVLDLGCGKGAYAVELARRDPDMLVVGVDFEPICIAYSAQAAIEGCIRNAVFTPGSAELVPTIFAPGELSRIHINFPTPFPRKKDAHMRLVSLEHVLLYREVLADGGIIRFKTDSLPLWRFSRSRFELAGFELVDESEDARADDPDEPFTLYEERMGAKGAKAFAADWRKAELPEATALLRAESADGGRIGSDIVSLSDFLPKDLDELDYVPYGMEA